ncbi:MAG: T9SS type A sorting domain-containing protein [Flavobacteriales bacterium]|nr:T9SS type A sorting domain-containing protein [Flavobacteriales bacterium]
MSTRPVLRMIPGDALSPGRPRPVGGHWVAGLVCHGLISLLGSAAFGQVNVLTGTYTQDFGTTDIMSWTNNVTFPGWYAVSHNTLISGAIGHQNITNAAPTNTGGFYSYECNGNNDQKLGARPSNSNPGSVGRSIRYGVILRNLSGGPITSIRVQYTGYQFSLAENDGVVNAIDFDYRVSATPPGMNGSGTLVPGLTYTAPNDDFGGTNNQVLGYPCTVSEQLTECIQVTIPLGSYILLRWINTNLANNDHHLGIDDVVVDFGINGSVLCDVLLPVSVVSFEAKAEEPVVRLEWITASEKDNAFFTVERSRDGQDFRPVHEEPGAGNSEQVLHYVAYDNAPLSGASYYRLRQTDLDGTSSLSQVVSIYRSGGNETSILVHSMGDVLMAVHHFPAGSVYELMDMTGRLLHSGITTQEGSTTIDAAGLQRGAYVLRLRDGLRAESVRFIH